MKQSLMPADPLRTRLKALVSSLSTFRANRLTFTEQMALWYELGVYYAADQLAALLAESEPERPEDLDVCPGCGVTARHLCEFWVDLDGKPHDCEDDCEGFCECFGYTDMNKHANQLAALLDETEDVKPFAPGMAPRYPPANIAADIRREEMGLPRKKHYSFCECTVCEAKAKLPLGHAYAGSEDGRDCKITTDFSMEGKCWLRCGQPRSAHEPK